MSGEQLASLLEYAPRGPDEARGLQGDPDWLPYQTMNEAAKVDYLSRRKAAAEQDFQSGFAQAAPLAAFDASRTPMTGFDASRGPMAGFDASRLPNLK